MDLASPRASDCCNCADTSESCRRVGAQCVHLPSLGTPAGGPVLLGQCGEPRMGFGASRPLPACPRPPSCFPYGTVPLWGASSQEVVGDVPILLFSSLLPFDSSPSVHQVGF